MVLWFLGSRLFASISGSSFHGFCTRVIVHLPEILTQYPREPASAFSTVSRPRIFTTLCLCVTMLPRHDGRLPGPAGRACHWRSTRCSSGIAPINPRATGCGWANGRNGSLRRGSSAPRAQGAPAGPAPFATSGNCRSHCLCQISASWRGSCGSRFPRSTPPPDWIAACR